MSHLIKIYAVCKFSYLCPVLKELGDDFDFSDVYRSVNYIGSHANLH